MVHYVFWRQPASQPARAGGGGGGGSKASQPRLLVPSFVPMLVPFDQQANPMDTFQEEKLGGILLGIRGCMTLTVVQTCQTGRKLGRQTDALPSPEAQLHRVSLTETDLLFFVFSVLKLRYEM